MTSGSDDNHELSDAVLSDAILAALGDGERVNHDAYRRAVATIAETGQFGTVLVRWATFLACAHLNGTAAFPHPAGVLPSVLTHARGLVTAARPTNPSLDPLMKRLERIVLELEDAELWSMFDLMAFRASLVATTCGGMARSRDATAFVLDCVHRTPVDQQRYEPAVGPVGLALAAIANGQLDPANGYLAVAVAHLELEVVLGVLLAVGTYLLSNPTGPIMAIDAEGRPLAIHSGDEHDPQTLPITRARDLIHAIKTGDKAAVTARVAAINTMSSEDVAVMSWHLALTLGYRLGQVFAASYQPRPT